MVSNSTRRVGYLIERRQNQIATAAHICHVENMWGRGGFDLLLKPLAPLKPTADATAGTSEFCAWQFEVEHFHQ